MAKETDKKILEKRPPVIVVMGHIDHGKSTLLDHIRESNVAEGEAGGITQHISAYEVVHSDEHGEEQKITFLDTPGHEAFQAMRSRGANVADIAILVVAADDGVKAQTLEALRAIKEANIPYVVAINKIDKPNANPQTTINSLIENEIYLEGYGGDIPYAQVSAKTGENINNILDLILLVAELEELKTEINIPAHGVVIESNVDPKKGVSATLIIKGGVLRQGMHVQAGKSTSPVRIMEDFMGASIKEAHASSPIRITGFDSAPIVGSKWEAHESKKSAKEASLSPVTKEEVSSETTASDTSEQAAEAGQTEEDERFKIPVVIKTDVAGSGEAISHEIKKLETDRACISILDIGIGCITEGDIRRASGAETGQGIVIGFNVKVDGSAKEIAKQQGVTLVTFNIIYELTKWLKEEIQSRTPKIDVEEITGKAKILKTFSTTKNKQVVGGRVIEGVLSKKAECIILRNEEEIGRGKILGLQQQKAQSEEVAEGHEFGMEMEANVPVSPGDIVEVFTVITK